MSFGAIKSFNRVMMKGDKLVLFSFCIWVFLISKGFATSDEECPQSVSDQCPAQDSSYPVYLEDPRNCATYCKCIEGTAYLQHCPGDTLWSTTDTACEKPSFVSHKIKIG